MRGIPITNSGGPDRAPANRRVFGKAALYQEAVVCGPLDMAFQRQLAECIQTRIGPDGSDQAIQSLFHKLIPEFKPSRPGRMLQNFVFIKLEKTDPEAAGEKTCAV